MKQAESIFQAIADPTRREIIGMLASKPMNVNAIADRFYVSRQAISLHLQCLNECGLIVVTPQGRERVCQANLENLDVVSDWVTESKKVWLGQFRSLENFLKTSASKKSTSSKSKKKKNANRSTNEVRKRN